MKKLLLVLSLIAIGLNLTTDVQGQGGTLRQVTQTGTITSPVTINSEIGQITTVATTLASGGSATFTVNNSACTPTSSVISDIQAYSGTYSTNGLPMVNVGNVSAGSFTLTIMNPHGANALNGTLTIGFICKQ